LENIGSQGVRGESRLSVPPDRWCIKPEYGIDP
jgi:hypothetical protein